MAFNPKTFAGNSDPKKSSLLLTFLSYQDVSSELPRKLHGNNLPVFENKERWRKKMHLDDTILASRFMPEATGRLFS